MSKIQIGITGGIGSGKSIVSRIMRAMQYPVYDTDSQAKALMQSPLIKQQLAHTWGNDIFTDKGDIDRAKLAAIVFNDSTQLTTLNNIVHPAVRQHYAQWVEQQQSHIVFVESAILHQAQMHNSLQHIWIVQADNETRIRRVMQRNNISRSEVEARIASQSEPPIDHRTHLIDNNDGSAIIPQILKLINIALNK